MDRAASPSMQRAGGPALNLHRNREGAKSLPVFATGQNTISEVYTAGELDGSTHKQNLSQKERKLALAPRDSFFFSPFFLFSFAFSFLFNRGVKRMATHHFPCDLDRCKCGCPRIPTFNHGPARPRPCTSGGQQRGFMCISTPPPRSMSVRPFEEERSAQLEIGNRITRAHVNGGITIFGENTATLERKHAHVTEFRFSCVRFDTEVAFCSADSNSRRPISVACISIIWLLETRSSRTNIRVDSHP